MLQNDLVHAFGVDLAWHTCAEPHNDGGTAMAVVDEVFIAHLGAPTLGEQGLAQADGQPGWCASEGASLRLLEARW